MTDPNAFVFGPFRLLVARRELLAHGVPVSLGQRAFDILLTLVSRHGDLVTKNELMAQVWPGVVVEENNLQVHISALRKLLAATSPDERYLVTVAGRGYRFVAPVARADALEEAACAGATSEDVPPVAGASAARPAWNNLPHHLTPLIGRQADLSELESRLRRHRLVTLVGAGGVGKTRLAIAVGGSLAGEFADGVALAELASLRDASLVTLVIADLFGIGTGEAALEELAGALKNRHCLLILDNCEHVIAEVARVADVLMQRCPRLAILASSREPLAIAGESVFRVPSLSTPEAGTQLTVETARDSAAIRLFVERASALGGGFALTDENASTVAAICRRLDGIPLAIELAVPRLKVLSLHELARGLDQRFRLLTHGSRPALGHHQTLRALLDWSYDLLSEPERRLLRRLGVFVGGTTLASITAVVVDEETTEEEVLDLLSSLVDKSMVVAELGGEPPRYRLLETTRYYARDKCAEARESRLPRRHAQHFADRLAEATAEWETTATTHWLARYGADGENLRAALDWAFGPVGDTAIGIELVGYSHTLSAELGLMLEHRRWVDQGLRGLTAATPPAVVARLLSWRPGDVKELDDPTDYNDAMRGAAIYRELGDTFHQGQMLLRAGASCLLFERAQEGEHLLQEAYALLHRHGPTKTLAQCLSALASARLFAGDVSGARSFHELALATCRDIADSADVGARQPLSEERRRTPF